mgnify:CR=1 FL=1
MLISSIHITQLDMAFQHFPVYTRLQDPDIIPPTNNTVLELQIKQLLDAGFTDISIASYLNYVANNPNINPKFPAIQALALAKIQVLVNEGEVDTTKHAQVIRLLSDIQQNLPLIATLTVSDFKEYLLSRPISLEDADALSLDVLDLSDEMTQFAKLYNVRSVGGFVRKLRDLATRGITMSVGTRPYDFSDCIVKLFKIGLLDRFESGLLLKRMSELTTYRVKELLGHYEFGASIDYLDLSILLDTKVIRNGFFYIGELIYVLINEQEVFSLKNFSKDEIRTIATKMYRGGYITQVQLDQILVKYDIDSEV